MGSELEDVARIVRELHGQSGLIAMEIEEAANELDARVSDSVSTNDIIFNLAALTRGQALLHARIGVLCSAILVVCEAISAKDAAKG